jgi:hypothetical protein
VEPTEAIKALDLDTTMFWSMASGTDDLHADAVRLAVYCCRD